MKLSRLVSRWAIPCAAIGLLALPAFYADAGPTKNRRPARAQASQASDSASSAGVVLTARIDERTLSGGPIVTAKAEKAAARAAAKAAKAQARFDVVAAAKVAKDAKRSAAAASRQQTASLRSNERAAKRSRRPATRPPVVEVPSTFPEPADVETPFDGSNGEGNNHGNGTGPIPEPSSVILFAAGAGLIGLLARKKVV